MKRIEVFTQDQEIPDRAQFLYAEKKELRDCVKTVFYYEVPVAAKKTATAEARETYKQELIERTIKYLNTKTGSRYTAKAKAHTAKILARINEGATKDNFKEVIDNKCDDWLGTDMDQYLRPETLFGSKFWGYLPNATKPDDPFAAIDSILESE